MKNKNVLILAANSDIGLQTTKIFLKNNWNVTAHFKGEGENTKILKKMKSRYKKLDFFEFDFLRIDDFERYISKNKDYFKKFDSFVSLTGLYILTNFSKFKIKDFNDHINVNYYPNILIIRELLNEMKRKKWGRILLASSIGTKFGGSEKSFIYSLSKYMNEFFPSYYKNYAKFNILINALKIGLTNTKLVKKDKSKNLNKRISLIPLKRMAETTEVASYIYFLCSENNTLITKEVINISGGE